MCADRIVDCPSYRTRGFTNNYVKYQPGYAAYAHPTLPNAALVCAAGQLDFKAVICMGAVSSSAAVRMGPQYLTRASPLIVGEAATRWLSYGGNDMQNTPAYKSRMQYKDESIHLLMQLGTLAIGEAVTFTTVNLMNTDYLTECLDSVGAVTILQPTDLMTGRASPFTVGE